MQPRWQSRRITRTTAYFPPASPNSPRIIFPPYPEIHSPINLSSTPLAGGTAPSPIQEIPAGSIQFFSAVHRPCLDGTSWTDAGGLKIGARA
jgi:hypothetical protein